MENELIQSLERQLLTFMTDPFNRPSSSFTYSGRRNRSPSPPTTPMPHNTRYSSASTSRQNPFASSAASPHPPPVSPPPVYNSTNELIAIIHEYQQTVRQYHTNMSAFISLLETQLHRSHTPPAQTYDETHSERSPPSPIHVPRERTAPEMPRLRRSRNTQYFTNTLLSDNSASASSSSSLNNILLSYYFRPRNGANDFTAINRLTPTQIAENTRRITYDSSLNETRCPITMEDFSEGEEVLQINGCGHYFKTDALMEWFRRNSHCPVCRHDITQNAQRRVFTSSGADADAYANADEDEDVEEITTSHFTFEIPMFIDASNNILLNETTPLLSESNEVERAFGRELLSALSSYMGRQI